MGQAIIRCDSHGEQPMNGVVCSKCLRERDRQQFEAGCRESARATCPTCASGDIPRPHSKLGGWFHIGPEGEDKQRVGCHAAAIYDLVPPAAQPDSESKGEGVRG